MITLLQDYFVSKNNVEVNSLQHRESAKNYFIYVLNSYGFKAIVQNEFRADLENKGRHYLIKASKGNIEASFYFVFKHDMFHSFNYQFKDFVALKPEYRGFGESLNVECLHNALVSGSILVFCYEDGRLLAQYPMLVKRFCNANSLVRVQKRENKSKGFNGKQDLVQETTYSFPVGLLDGFKTFIERIRGVEFN